MSDVYPFPKTMEVPVKLSELLLDAAVAMAEQAPQAFRIGRTYRGGATLRPGAETPLWNELRAQLRPHLKAHGSQANLARILGLPRQRINDFITGKKMPDAERTLQLLAWLLAAQRNRKPA